MRILVTGAGGFIGKAAVRALTAAGHEVCGIYRKAPPAGAAASVVVADLEDRRQVAAILRDVRPDVILHLAWSVEHGKFWTSPDNLDCVTWTLALARAAAEAGCRRFVGVGTCFEYEFPASGDCDEFTTPVGPRTLYGAAKDACRRCLETYFRDAGLSFAWARVFYPYGPGEHPDRLVPSLAAKLAAGEPALLSSGRMVADFIHVDDVAGALAALCASDVSGPVNVGTGQGVAVAEIARRLAEIAGRPDLLRIGALPDREGEPVRVVGSVHRLTREVKFKPRISLTDGIAAYFR
jgi:nucleoside-diphosphate-sugar epimerase